MSLVSQPIFTLEMVVASLADHTHDAVVITKAEPIREHGPEIVWVNRSFTEMTGYSAEEVIGQTPRILQGADIDREARQRIFKCLQEWQPIRETLKNYRKDGTHFWVDLSIKPVADPNGWFVYWVAIQRDVTEQVEQKEALRLAMEEAKAAETAQTNFLSTMSHEIRTPLNGLLGSAQILPMLGDLNDAQMSAVRDMQESGEILLELIDDILDLARIRAGKSNLELASVYPADLVRKAVRAVRSAADSKDLDVFTSISSDAVLPFFSDRRRLLQILVNLVGNAVKFTERGQIQIRVRRPTPGQIEFAVKDTGPGIPAELLSSIFEPFQQISTGLVRKYGGAGLGLAISQEFTTLLGGKLTAESEVGKGSTFRLVVPFSVEEPMRAANDPGTHAPSLPISTPGRVLIIEDNELNRSIVEKAFALTGWSVMAVETCNRVVDLVYDYQPDVIVLDRHLPEKSGDEILGELRSAEDAVASIPVIMLTADARLQAERETIALGASCFFSKPVDIMLLLRAAEKLIQASETSPPGQL